MPATNDIAKSLAMALYFEQKSFDYYTEKYNELTTNLYRDLLQFLANQEKDHINKVKELQASFIKKGKIGKEPVKIDPLLFNPITEIKDESHEIEILHIAMAFEKRAKEFYAKEEKNAKDPEIKQFFHDMTKFEEAHFKLIEGLYESSMYVRLES
jgi:rubrerythrin